MSRIAYVNGRYGPLAQAQVSIEDRGYQFADGVYEVIAVDSSRLIDWEPHLDRLDRSLALCRIPAPMPRRALLVVLGEVVRRNRVQRGMVYLQVTRGIARRDHGFPAGARPSLVVTARRSRPITGGEGAAAIILPDLRWGRCDIKSLMLLANVLAKQAAIEAGAVEAILVGADGLVTEGASTNVWIVTSEGTLITRPASAAILNGVTRRAVLAEAEAAGLVAVERAFSLEELASAVEVLLTSTTLGILAVTQVDGQKVGSGRPGPLGLRLQALYREHVGRGAG